METIERLINKEGDWKATIAFSKEEALSQLNSNDFKIVLLCAGIDNELDLTAQLKTLYPTVPVVKHYGGGSGLLYAEIYQGLKS